MNDPGLNNLFKWAIENSAASREDPNAPAPRTQIDIQALQQLPGMPQSTQSTQSPQSPQSPSTLMKNCMEMIKGKNGIKVPLEKRVEAFKVFEELIERIDNAHSVESTDHWGILLGELHSSEPEMRMHAASSIRAVVQNNPRGQQRLLILGAIPTLVKLAIEDEDKKVRMKAVRVLSCASRNFQPGLDAIVENLPAQFKPKGKLDAGDMDSVDSLINPLTADAARER